jgi:hypothetical protein
MATVHVIASGAWNANKATVWNTGDVPAPNDAIVFDGDYTVALDLTTVPATGAFASITSAGQSGRITIDMSTGTFVINVTGDITAGTDTLGLINATGTPGANTLTVNCANLYGGSATGAVGINTQTASHKITFNGISHGGSGLSSYGIYVGATGQTLAHNGDSYGGTGGSAVGILNVGACVVTLKGNLYLGATSYSPAFANRSSTAPVFDTVHSVQFGAYYGPEPTWTVLATDVVDLGTKQFALVVSATNLRSGIHNGAVTGTLIPTIGIM